LKSVYIGIDFGTSGCRAIAINGNNTILAKASIALPESLLKNGHIVQNPHDWWLACHLVLDNLLSQIHPEQVKAISIDGTSGTVLLCNADGSLVSDAYMYNDNNNILEAEKIKQLAPSNSGAHGSSSGLAKCLTLLKTAQLNQDTRCLTQADWIAGIFTQRFDFTDQNNSLKLGYDAVNQQWPEWLNKMDCRSRLVDNVYSPGDIISIINPQIAKTFDLPNTTKIVAGTTDSIAAFYAADCQQTGEAVTSLGSTLAIKLISDKPIYAPEYGVYSHRFRDKWLVGGASNTGGAVLNYYFNHSQMKELTTQLDPHKNTGLDYYPLLVNGERFPVNDPELAPKLDPRPENDLLFFQGMLEGIANIEKNAYHKLVELGASYPTHIKTMGGGSVNFAWQTIRSNLLEVPIEKAEITDAAYGSALLAKQGIQQ